MLSSTISPRVAPAAPPGGGTGQRANDCTSYSAYNHTWWPGGRSKHETKLNSTGNAGCTANSTDECTGDTNHSSRAPLSLNTT